MGSSAQYYEDMLSDKEADRQARTSFVIETLDYQENRVLQWMLEHMYLPGIHIYGNQESFKVLCKKLSQPRQIVEPK